MSARKRANTKRANTKRSNTASAIALTAAVTASAALLLTGCGPSGSAKAQAAPSGTATQPTSPSASQPTSAPTSAPTPTPSAPSTPFPTPTSSTAPVDGSPVSLNGTGGSRLTISDGTDYVVMNGTRVDFGTIVRDLSWNPAGTKAAFINGSGDLVVSNPNGSGQVVVARNPGNQVWSHPVWTSAPAQSMDLTTHSTTSLYFAASVNGASRLEAVAASAVDGTPAVALIHPEMESPQLPATGNEWPSGGDGGALAPDIAYANSGNGEVYIRDTYLRQQSYGAVQGSEPAISSDDSELVFVRSVDGHDHLFEQSQNQSQKVKDLTPDATTDYTEPTWSPDGRTIAARTPAGIVTLAADGAGAPVLVSSYAGLPAYRG